ncbi:MAG: hypothetical protein QXO98_01110 [Sulfolobales archaeon]
MKASVKLSMIAAISLAIIVLSITTIVSYAKPNDKGFGLLAATSNDDVNDFNGIGLQKMLRYRFFPPGKGLGLIKAVELSEEFKNRVIDILESDENTSKLLSDGYNVTLLRPIIKLVVQGDGSVALKVVEVQVTLYKKGEGVVHVLVDYDDGKVIKIWEPKYCECKCLSS